MSGKLLEIVNSRLHGLTSEYASGNAHGIPVTRTGNLELRSLSELKFSEPVGLNSHTPAFLRKLADILEDML